MKPLPRARIIVGSVISAVVLVVGLVTLEWTHALVLAALPLPLMLVVRSLATPDEPIIAADRLTQGAGRRDEMSALVWAMRSRSGRVPPRTMRRVGDLAARLLAHHGVASDGGFPLVVAPADVDRVRTLLGAGAAVLLDADQRTETHPRDLDRCLTALESLDPTDRPTALRTGGSR
ncbi:hypothetical protein ACTVCO_08965 [Sanguibacter sp. A247]|uniref:hypothetical protein n=1 Tax=unclassified Sanguibacter TaxID=2645534 RepID=UPI003FD7A0BE